MRDSLKKLESDQSDRVGQLTRELKECKEELKERVRERDETNEQTKQHVSMICALEERLNIAVNKNKEQQTEIARLLGTVTGNMMRQEQRCNFKSLLFIIALFMCYYIQWEIGGIVAIAIGKQLRKKQFCNLAWL